MAKNDAWDNCHHAIDQLTLMITLDLLLDGRMKSREVIYKLCQPLMADEVVAPLVKIFQHPRIGVRPPILVTSNVDVNNLDMRHPCGHHAESVEENLLWVDSVAAGVAVAKVHGRKGQLFMHQPEFTLKTEYIVKAMQLAIVEVCHLQCSCVGKIDDAEIFFSWEN
jgi:hypothetical protein